MGQSILFAFGRASLPAMVEHWGRPACPGVRIPGAIPVFTRMMPCPSRGRSRAPTQRVSSRSVTPHHRSASPFPVPSIPLRAGHPKRASRLRGSDSLLTQEPPSEVVPPLSAGTGIHGHASSGARLSRCRTRLAPADTNHPARCPPLLTAGCNENDGAGSVLLIPYSDNAAQPRTTGMVTTREAGSC
jgi:hypothetical protein